MARPRTTKRRTPKQMKVLHDAMTEFCSSHHPLSVRALYYLMAQSQLVPKTDKGYRFVKEESGKLRESGRIPFAWLTDESRRVIQVYTCDDLPDALSDTASQYRRNIWTDQPRYVELWCEAKASISALTPLTEEWHVRLVPVGGFGSKAFLYDCAQHLARITKPIDIIYVGDFDPSGLGIERDIKTRLQRYAPGIDFKLTRAALTEEQVREWELPTRPPKVTDTRIASFTADSVAELEAIPPTQLRQLCGDAISELIDEDILQATKDAERGDLRRLEELSEMHQ